MNNMIRSGYVNTVQRMQEAIINSAESITKNLKPFLFTNLQGKMARKEYGGILERQNNALFPTSKQEYRRKEKPKLEGWKKVGQRRICFNTKTKPSIFRLSWLRERTQINNRTSIGEGIATN